LLLPTGVSSFAFLLISAESSLGPSRSPASGTAEAVVDQNR
jgi:hypothetical protein